MSEFTGWFECRPDGGDVTAAARWQVPASTLCEVWTPAVPEWTPRSVLLDLVEDPDWVPSTEDAVESWIAELDGGPDESLTIALANVWHDELGRFAEKGVGRRFTVITGGNSQMGRVDFRYIADPDQRFAAMLQFEYGTMRAVRRAAQNLREGRDPMHHQEPPGEIVPNAWNDEGDYEVYPPEALVTDVVLAAEWLNALPVLPEVDMYRGMRLQVPANELFVVGDRVPFDYVSGSPSEMEARLYASNDGSGYREGKWGTVMTVRQPMTVALSEHASGKMSQSQEHLLVGEAVVVAVTSGTVELEWATGGELAMMDRVEQRAAILAALDQPQHDYDADGRTIVPVAPVVASAAGDRRVLLEYPLVDEALAERFEKHMVTAYQRYAKLLVGELRNRSTLMSAASWRDIVMDLLSDDIADGVVDAMVGSNVRASFTLRDATVDKVLAAHIEQVRAFGQPLRGSVTKWLTKALDEGMGVDEAMRQLPKSSPLSPESAYAAARTELIAAANGGAYLGYLEAGATRKTWITANDERVRPAHVDMEGVEVDLLSDWIVDGHPAAYPGDPRLPIGLRIMCRCSLYAGFDDEPTISKKSLLAQAAERDIPGRTRMSRDELQVALAADVVLDEMNKAQAYLVAKQLEIPGRSRMSLVQLKDAIRSS